MNEQKYDALKIENQLCFPLYACSREIIKQYKPFLDKIDLTYTQYIVMMVMWEKKSVNVKELGECLYLDSGTLTPLLKKLEVNLVKQMKTRLEFFFSLSLELQVVSPDFEELLTFQVFFFFFLLNKCFHLDTYQ